MNQSSIFSKFDILYLLALALMLGIPSRLDPAIFLQIHQPMKVESHKNFPPYLAHQEISKGSIDGQDTSEFSQTIELATIERSTIEMNDEVMAFELSDAKTMVLDEVSLFKSELATYEIPEALLEPQVVKPETIPSVVDPQTKAIFSQTGAFSTASNSQIKAELPQVEAQESDPRKEGTSHFVIGGTIVIQQGLGLTNDHFFEIRRIKEGVVLERGTVNVQAATYSIKVSDTGGQIRGRILAKNGQVLGEGSGLITNVGQNAIDPRGPKLVLIPRDGVSGVHYSQYDAEKKPLVGANVNILHGSEKAEQDQDLYTQDTRLGQGSMTLLSVEAPKNFLVSRKIVYSGEKFSLPILPERMAKSLREMVSDQRQQDLNDPHGTLIWGQVKIDGMPLSGISVEIESAPDILPVYLNEYFLPDPGLKATSTNGYFAFLQVEPGFHSLLALRGDKYFSHDNVIVERGAVSISEIKTATASKPAKVRAYDYFSGISKEASVELQSVDHPVQTVAGQATVVLPNLNRMSLINVNPDRPYIHATYQYNDVNDFVDIPLIQNAWLQQIQTRLKINSIPNRGIVIGFVGDEDFEVYSALENKGIVAVYFDNQGNPLEHKQGVTGGGFILFNVPLGTNEVIIFGDRTQKLYSQVVPIDSGSLNVLTFRSGY
jgi:hypothetical protein